MKARHKKSGGAVVYSGAKSKTVKEAGESTKASMKDMGKVEGSKPKMRLDKRARGGRTSATSNPMAPASSTNPFSSAHGK